MQAETVTDRLHQLREQNSSLAALADRLIVENLRLTEQLEQARRELRQPRPEPLLCE